MPTTSRDYLVVYSFQGQIVFEIHFQGEDMPADELEDSLLEMAEIIRGKRVGIIKRVTSIVHPGK